MSLRPVTLVRLGAAVVSLSRLASAARTRPPVVADDDPGDEICVVVPARDEAERISPLLTALCGAPGVAQLIVVDDESSDTTASLASAAGAVVVHGQALPAGWTGKPWALQQGVDAAMTEWVVTLDADTRPDPRLPSSVVARATRDGTDLLTLAGRFECPTSGVRWLHPAMLTTLVYRFGGPGRRRRPQPDRLIANGQCMAFRRQHLISAGGFEPVAGALVDDVALARRLGAHGWSVDFLDASELLTVRMYESFAESWTGWGRSLGLPGIEPRWRRLAELLVLAISMPLPWLRLAMRRADALDAVLIVARLGTLAGTRRSYRQHGVAYWLSPFADPVAVLAVARSALRSRCTWRGRRIVIDRV